MTRTAVDEMYGPAILAAEGADVAAAWVGEGSGEEV